jgi:hypothetical protein
MTKRLLAPACALLVLPALSHADDPPVIEHQQALCTVSGKPLSLCAAISDDGTVATAHLYFRREGEDYYSFVDMGFTGLSYCGTVPAPREGKVKAIEYYVQAVDNAYQSQRTSTFRLPVEPEGKCDFPPVEKNEARAAAIRVFATSRKQGKKIDGAFESDGVTFVPVQR